MGLTDVMIRLALGDVDDPRVRALLIAHAARARAETEPGSDYWLDPEVFSRESIELWTAWERYELLGTSAWKRRTGTHRELKAFYTTESARRRGVASLLLERIHAGKYVESTNSIFMTRVLCWGGSRCRGRESFSANLQRTEESPMQPVMRGMAEALDLAHRVANR
ncbi:MAG: GNAT family N-acetyltransferase [Myxococcales bacterium]|nr:GNAT family N-acetyltransferase [Myxococcales bacterium]